MTICRKKGINAYDHVTLYFQNKNNRFFEICYVTLFTIYCNLNSKY